MNQIRFFNNVGNDFELIEAPEDGRPHEVLLVILHLEVTFITTASEEGRNVRKHVVAQLMEADNAPSLLTQLLLNQHKSVLPLQVFGATFKERRGQDLMEQVPVAEGKAGPFIRVIVLVEDAVYKGVEVRIQVFFAPSI